MVAASHRHPPRLGFAASAGSRALMAAVFAVAVVAALLVIEGMPAGPASAPATLSIEATAAVSRWEVRVDGVEATGAATGPASWRCELPDEAVEVRVEAYGADALPIALRLSLHRQRDEIEQLAWGRGSASCTMRVRGGDHHD